MAVLLRADSARWRVIRWTSFLLVFWAVDGFVQLIFGNDLFGIAMNPDRLNALFVQKYQFYGPTLAMLSPLLLEHARRHWPAWAWVDCFHADAGRGADCRNACRLADNGPGPGGLPVVDVQA